MISRLFAILVLLTFASTTAQAQIGRQGGPMDITSDHLEVIDAENKAVFSGNVDAAQGDTRLRADQIEVFFSENSTSSAATGGFGDVQRVLATGDVFYVTPSEVARGNRALYQITTETITMTGDVVLTRGENVITGSCLIANLTTGRSQINPPSCAPTDATASTTTGGRVRAVLFPANDSDEDSEGEDE